MTFPIDSNIVGALVCGLLVCVVGTGWIGWSARSWRANRDHSRFVRDLCRPSPGEPTAPEVEMIFQPWWDSGYAKGYRDGKNNRKRKDLARPAGGYSG